MGWEPPQGVQLVSAKGGFRVVSDKMMSWLAGGASRWIHSVPAVSFSVSAVADEHGEMLGFPPKLAALVQNCSVRLRLEPRLFVPLGYTLQIPSFSPD